MWPRQCFHSGAGDAGHFWTGCCSEHSGTAFLCTRARDGFLLGQGISTPCYVVFLWVSAHCSASSPALVSCLFIFLIKPLMVPADSVTTDWLQPQIPTPRSGPCPPRSKAASPQANPVSVPLGLLCRAHHVPPVWGCWPSLSASPDWQSLHGIHLGSATGLQTPWAICAPRAAEGGERADSVCGSLLAGHMPQTVPRVDTALIPTPPPPQRHLQLSGIPRRLSRFPAASVSPRPFRGVRRS